MSNVTGLLDGQFTIGVEEEFQIVHAETRELRSYVSQLLEEGRSNSLLRERVRPEMHQSVVETGTGICRDIKQAREEISELRAQLGGLAKKGGMRIVAAGTHPFSDWKTQDITDGERYKGIVEDLQDVARANLIFGLHVHVGIKDKDTAMALANQVRYFLPHILALSVSSPFWLGRETGLKSTRSEIFKRFPPARASPGTSPRTRRFRRTSICSCARAVSTTRRRSGGTCAPTPSSTPSRCACAT
jgi:carboxylate-amine ligase